MAEKIMLQRIVTIQELAKVLSHEGKRLYKHNSIRMNTTLEKTGMIAVDLMFRGQYDAVTCNKDTGDDHALIVMEVPASRIIEKGTGVYFDYPCLLKVFCDEFVLAGYRSEEIKAVYNLKGKSFHDVYDDLQFGRIEHIKLKETDLKNYKDIKMEK